MTIDSAEARPRVAISACLLGEEVRYDGGHKLAADLVDALATAVELVSVCPEVGIGLGVPREPIELVEAAGGGEPGLVGVRSRVDHRAAMVRYVESEVSRFLALRVRGFVAKSRSPSCGLDVSVRDPEHRETSRSAGLFVRELRKRLPDLPIVEDEALADPDRVREFLERVEAYRP